MKATFVVNLFQLVTRSMGSSKEAEKPMYEDGERHFRAIIADEGASESDWMGYDPQVQLALEQIDAANRAKADP